MQEMHESHSQSDFKLPFIDSHSQHRLPIRMDPSYRLKHTNPMRVQYMKFMERKSLDELKNETYYLEKFAKANHYSYQESHKYESRNREVLQRLKKDTKPKIHYQKPNLKYFNLDDSDIHPEQVNQIFHKKHKADNQKVFISE